MGIWKFLTGGGSQVRARTSSSLGEIAVARPGCGYEKMELIAATGFPRGELYLRCRPCRSFWIPEKSDYDKFRAMTTEPGTPMTPFTDD